MGYEALAIQPMNVGSVNSESTVLSAELILPLLLVSADRVEVSENLYPY